VLLVDSPNLTGVDLWDILIDTVPYMVTDVVYHPAQEECPRCYGAKQTWDSDSKLMIDCYLCQGRGTAFLGTAHQWRMGYRWDPVSQTTYKI
jgi:hypothetical protein